MKNILSTLFLVTLLLTKCATKNSVSSKISEAKQIQGAASIEPTEGTLSLEQYSNELNNMDLKNESSLKSLELFKNSFKKSNQIDNDKALKIYLEFQAQLMDTLNDRLMRRSDYEMLNSLIWADSTLHEKEALAYEKELNKNGLLFASTEGIIYVTRDTETIRNYFFQYLTPPTKEFFNQFEKETNEPNSEDGGLIISVRELAERLIFWDDFLSTHPDHIFAEFAKNNVESNLYVLLVGMDNTPAYDYDTKKIDKEFLDAYHYLVKNYVHTNSYQVVNSYLKLLERNGYKKNTEIEAFIQKYAIY